MPTMPTLTSNWNWRAAPPSRVKIAVPLPYGLSLMSVQRLLVRPDPHDRSGRARRSRRGRRPCRAVTLSISDTPRKNPSEPRYSGCSRPSATTVAPCSAALSRYDATLSRCCWVTSGPISAAGSVPGPDLDLGQPRPDRLDERVGDVAHRDDRRDRHAPLARRAVGRRHGRVGGHVDVGVGQHEHVVLGAAQRLDALAVAGARLVDVAGDRRRADERDGRDVGVVEDPRRPRPCRPGRR